MKEIIPIKYLERSLCYVFILGLTKILFAFERAAEAQHPPALCQWRGVDRFAYNGGGRCVGGQQLPLKRFGGVAQDGRAFGGPCRGGSSFAVALLKPRHVMEAPLDQNAPTVTSEESQAQYQCHQYTRYQIFRLQDVPRDPNPPFSNT